MISIDGRLREKSNAKVAMNESRAADAKENELSIGKVTTIVRDNLCTLRIRRERFHRGNNANPKENSYFHLPPRKYSFEAVVFEVK